MQPSKPLRRSFTFSLRAVFLLLTAFCLWLGWQLKIIRDRAEIDWIESHSVGATFLLPNLDAYRPPPPGEPHVPLQSNLSDSQLLWHRLLGEVVCVDEIQLPKKFADRAPRLQQVFPAAVITIESDAECAERNADSTTSTDDDVETTAYFEPADGRDLATPIPLPPPPRH